MALIKPALRTANLLVRPSYLWTDISHTSGLKRPQIRTVSSPPVGSELMREYLVLVPDFPGKLQTRVATKAAHGEGAMSMINRGRLPYFGVTLAKHAKEEETSPDINGSMMVVRAESEEVVRDFLAMDAYTMAGVWDVANAKIVPFKGG